MHDDSSTVCCCCDDVWGTAQFGAATVLGKTRVLHCTVCAAIVMGKGCCIAQVSLHAHLLECCLVLQCAHYALKSVYSRFVTAVHSAIKVSGSDKIIAHDLL